MNVIVRIFQDFFFTQESKFLSLLSFFLTSLLSLHFLFFFSFFNFSDKWIDKEARMSTLQIQPKIEEKKISKELKEKILSTLKKNMTIKEIDEIRNDEIKEFLDIDRVDELSNIRLPLFINLEFFTTEKKAITNELIELIGERYYILSDHTDELTDVLNLINKIRFFILITGSLMFVIFIFFLSLVIKTTFSFNYKFLEVIEIMGASSKLIAFNVSLILVKKIIPGMFFGLIFSFVILASVISLFDMPMDILVSFSFIDLIILLLLFIFGIIFIFIILYVFIFNFLEKRFFG